MPALSGSVPVPVTVVGAGVIGLTTAVRLAEAGHAVTVVARDHGTSTTSAVAAALWFPYRVLPYDRVLAWSSQSYATFSALAAESPESGVELRWGTELLRSDPSDLPDPWWASAVPDLTVTRDVPPGYTCGWRFLAPVIDMPRYLPWLASRATAAGATIDPSPVSVSDLADLGPLVVDCTGIGARDLVPDHSVTPVRGQVVVLAQVGLDEWLSDDLDDHILTYIVPRQDDIIVGGTADESVWDVTPDPATATAILTRACALLPSLAAAPILAHKVGLRPTRPEVRLEPEHRGPQTIIHNYGHGGAGVTLSWPCADEVVALLSSITD
jgi:D-amino-acid oxidase